MSQEYRKKLIEVALPLEAINSESAREKSIRHGHPSTLHQWWARRPLAACRAVLFASLVDDPSSLPELFPTEEEQEAERKRLFEIIEQLVKWENANSETVLLLAQTEIARSIARSRRDDMPRGAKAIRKYLAEKAPPVVDPFCGGGSIPLEAQRLGLKAYGSDLNPVAVLISKALTEIPVKFAGRRPVNPEAREDIRLVNKEWKGAEGLAEDVRYYGNWMREETEKRIGHLYPKIQVTSEITKNRPDLRPFVGQELTIIAWLWSRTVKCANPACGARMPLVSSFWLSTRQGKKAWVEPTVDRVRKSVRFEVCAGNGTAPDPPKVGRGAKFKCIVCGELAEDQHIKNEGIRGNMSAQLMAIVAEGQGGRLYLSPTEEHASIAERAEPMWRPDQPLADDPRNIWCVGYGLDKLEKLFTDRQLLALTTFSDLVKESREKVLEDAETARTLPSDDRPLISDGLGSLAYAEAISTYLAFAIDKLANLSSTLCSWMTDRGAFRETFARQAMPMVWDYAESNPFSKSGGNIGMLIGRIADVIDYVPSGLVCLTKQLDATEVIDEVERPIVVTDPPYYDNIGYADLSDFFYVWLRRSLNTVYPQLFATMVTPKSQELIASPYRHRGAEEAKAFFEEGLSKAFGKMHEVQSNHFPLTLFYAFRQTETVEGGSNAQASTGWETMLAGLIASGFSICGTWPMRTESPGRSIARGTNALASSVVLSCRPRAESAPLATRREFLSILKEELPGALSSLQHGNIAPVDLAQASIGPGMAVFTRYSKVIEADGTPMSVRTALGLINQMLDEALAEQEGEFDPDTRWAIAWFEQFCMEEGPFGSAETLSKAKDTAVNGLVDAGIIEARAGKVHLLKRDELLEDWDPAKDSRFTSWEAAQHLILELEKNGEQAAADLLRKLGGGHGETARDLAYRLYNICERKGWAAEALAYNSLAMAWPEIIRLARASTAEGFGPQTEMFETE